MKLVVLCEILLIPCFFPNVSFGLLDSDTVPLGLLCCLLILFMLDKKYPKKLLWIFIPTIAAAPWMIAAIGDWSVFFRQAVIYTTVPIVSIATYKAMMIGVNINKLVKFSIYTAICGGILQILISRNILVFIVKARGDEVRGVSSFFPEPSFFGLTLIMFGLIYISSSKKGEVNTKVLSILGAAVVFISQSSLAILVLILMWLTYYLLRFSFTKLAFAVFFLSIFILMIRGVELNTGIRAFALLNLVLNNPFEILRFDASVSERVFHIYIAFRESVNDFFLPHGFYSFGNEIIKEQLVNDLYWWGGPTNKIMSGIGGALYEIGFIGIMYVIIPVYLAISAPMGVKKNSFFVIVGGVLVYLNSINFATPYFSVLLGVVAYNSRKCRHNEKERRTTTQFSVGSPILS